MPSVQAPIVNRLGLHARAAARLTHIASSFQSDIWLARFDRAMQAAQAELQALKAHIAPDAPQELEAFLDLHRMILNDSALAIAPRELIRGRRANAEWALVQQMERLVERFDQIDDPYLRERKADVQHAVERVLKA